MNPLTQVRNIKKLNETELRLGIAGEKKSWHDVYKDSAWIFVGGLNFDLTEGDVISVFSQYGEVVNMNMVRDPKTGKSRGFAFICYEDQRSTILAVDNLNSIKVAGRTMRVDHVANYKPPKEKDETDELTRLIYERGCGPEVSMEQLEKEAAKREAQKSWEQKGEKKNFNKKWSDSDRPRGPDYRRPETFVKEEPKVKVEYDDEGDVRRGPAPAVNYDDDGDIVVNKRRSTVDYDDDGDIVVNKRRSVEPSTERRRDDKPYHRQEDRDRHHHQSGSSSNKYHSSSSSSKYRH